MERGNNSNSSAPRQEVISRPSFDVIPAKSNIVPQYQTTSKYKNEDKATGSYQRYTATESVSTGARHVERGSGQLGVKNEATRSQTVKIGNKNGYTEYYKEERVREVDFGTIYKSVKNYGGGGTSNNSSTNQLTTYGNGGYYDSSDDDNGGYYDSYDDDDGDY